jgi:hypothetical protein
LASDFFGDGPVEEFDPAPDAREDDMQRLPKIEKEDISGDLARFYEAVTGLLGRVPNFYRTISRAPWLAMLLLPFNATVQR